MEHQPTLEEALAYGSEEPRQNKPRRAREEHQPTLEEALAYGSEEPRQNEPRRAREEHQPTLEEALSYGVSPTGAMGMEEGGMLSSVPSGPPPINKHSTISRAIEEWLFKPQGTSEQTTIGSAPEAELRGSVVPGAETNLGREEALKQLLWPPVNAVQSGLERIGDVVRGGAETMNNPLLQTSSVPLNAISGIPGALASVAGELGASTVEELPALAATEGLGAIGRASGAFPWIAKQAEQVAPKMFYLGGMSPEEKAAFTARNVSQMRSTEEAGNLGMLAATLGTGKVIPQEERQVIGRLMEQPEWRGIFEAQGPEVRTVSPVLRNILAATERPTPGVENPLVNAASLQMEFSQPLFTYGRVARELETAFGKTRGQMAALGIIDPDGRAWQRMADVYRPYVNMELQADRIALMPNRIAGTRQAKNQLGYMKMRSSQTEEARIAQGFASDPSFPVAIRYAQEQATINNRMLYDSLARENATVHFPVNPMEVDAPAGGVVPQITPEGMVSFVKMPADAIFGPLSGQMVRKPVHDEIMAIKRFSEQIPTQLRRWYSTWKFSKTVLSPRTHINNFLSNVVLAHMAGLSPWRLDIYRAAAREMVKKSGVFYKEARRAGAQWTFRNAGIGRIMDAIDLGGGALRPEATGNILVRFLDAVPRLVQDNRYSRAAGEMYQGTEAFFKHAVYMQLRRKGVGIEEAISRANTGLVDYMNIPAIIREVRSSPTGIPFVTFTYGVAGPLLKTAFENPKIYLQYKIITDAWNRIAGEAIGANQNDIDDIGRYFGGKTPLIFPARDAAGGILCFDVARAFPWADWTPGRRGGLLEGMGVGLAGAVGGAANLAQSTLLKNPAVSEVLAQITGVDPYFQQSFAPPLGGVGTLAAQARQIPGAGALVDFLSKPVEENATGARLAHLGRTLLPELLGGGTTQNVVRAARGKRSFLGAQRSPIQALLEGAVSGHLTPLNEARLRAAKALMELNRMGQGAIRSQAMR